DIDQVELVTGQAAFVLPEQRQRSFIVVSASGRVVAQSRARFDLHNTDDSVCVTCFGGEVRVEKGTQAISIGEGQQVAYDRNGLGPVMGIDVAEATSWQDGFIVFRYTPLSLAVAEINRYRPGKVVVLSETLGRKTVSGRFKIERIEEVLTWIE